MDDDTHSDTEDGSEPEDRSGDRRESIPEEAPRVVRRTRNTRRGRSGRSGAVVGRDDGPPVRERGSRTAEPEKTEPEPEPESEPEDLPETEPDDAEPAEPASSEITEPDDDELEDHEPEDPEPAASEDTEPAEPDDTEPAEPEDHDPEDAEPAASEETEPAEPEDHDPEDAEPAASEETEPAEPEDTEPEDTEPEDTEPADDSEDLADDDLEADRSSVMPPADQPDYDDHVVLAASGQSTRSKLVLAGAVVALLGLLTWIAFFRDDEVAAPPPTTTTSSTATTEPAKGWPAESTQVATAKAGVSEVQVLSSPPPEWDTSTEVLRWEAPALPASQATVDPRPALPRADYSIEGRYVTDTGWRFSNPTSFGEPLTFVVTEARGNWVKVLLPVRPNHTEGYVSRDQVDLSQHDYRIELRLSEHRLTAYRGSELIADTPVVTGKDATRTPTGRFFVTDKVEQSSPDGFYGPYILALNGYSEQLDIFDDGVPVIAIHGTSRPDLLGTSASNGCVRIPNEVITQLHDEVPLGTPVEIYA